MKIVIFFICFITASCALANTCNKTFSYTNISEDTINYVVENCELVEKPLSSSTSRAYPRVYTLENGLKVKTLMMAYGSCPNGVAFWKDGITYNSGRITKDTDIYSGTSFYGPEYYDHICFILNSAVEHPSTM